MSLDRLPKGAVAFIESLVTLKPGPTAIWLMGSRANGGANEESDTDLLVFGCEDFLSAIQKELHRSQDVDCLVSVNGNEFKDPWSNKAINFSELEWLAIDDFTATYIGTKWIPDEEDVLEFGADFAADLGRLVESRLLAVRIWPAPETDKLAI